MGRGSCHIRGLPAAATFSAARAAPGRPAAAPDDVLAFAAVGESLDPAGGVAQENAAAARLAGGEEKVAQLG